MPFNWPKGPSDILLRFKSYDIRAHFSISDHDSSRTDNSRRRNPGQRSTLGGRLLEDRSIQESAMRRNTHTVKMGALDFERKYQEKNLANADLVRRQMEVC